MADTSGPTTSKSLYSEAEKGYNGSECPLPFGTSFTLSFHGPSELLAPGSVKYET